MYCNNNEKTSSEIISLPTVSHSNQIMFKKKLAVENPLKCFTRWFSCGRLHLLVYYVYNSKDMSN